MIPHREKPPAVCMLRNVATNLLTLRKSYELLKCLDRQQQSQSPRRIQLYGIEAINASNGWAIAIIGASIVMSGLAFLSFVISQLHRIITAFENLKVRLKSKPKTAVGTPEEMDHGHFPTDINDVAAIYQPLMKDLADAFQLSELYALCRKSNFPHPHLTITRLRETGILSPQGDGLFTWNR
jgi:hypothetical protein